MKGMNSKQLLAGLAVFALTLMLGCGTAEPPVSDSAVPAAADQWITLFDGQTLEGWEDPAKETPPGDSWVVEDGWIKATRRPRLREDLFTKETFGDFELVFEWKISPNGNSGVKYRIQDRAILIDGKTNPDSKRFEDTVDYELANRTADRSSIGPDERMQEYVVAFEYQIIDNEGHKDALRGADRTTGAIYSMVPASSQEASPVGEVNVSRIILRGNQVEHWLNGKKVVDTSLEAEPIRAGLEKRWTAESPVYKLLTEMPKRETPIGLQHHNDEAWFRNLRIRRLD
jgi:hypothetical protein